MQFIVLKKRSIMLFLIICLSIMTAAAWYMLNSSSVTAFNQQEAKPRVIHLVTGEFKSKLPNGKEIEAYRWDPGTIFIEKDEKAELRILGVNGEEHPFYIEGTDTKGTVKKGEETVVPLQFEKEGVYRLICLTHPDKSSNGPMIAYIVVD
ncbi:hypothetical protein [Mesobacillus harenae]|uniref:hypothetical protein n=1 Tax=Mesobacillus harenae TaxID=2213203 RepID=UPI0015802D8C|nr:hypothetical protein [Mesobacillus harenae]